MPWGSANYVLCFDIGPDYSRVADLEAQNASLLAQLSAGIPAGADGALVRALQARIGGRSSCHCIL
jgi:hypothetical protein